MKISNNKVLMKIPIKTVPMKISNNKVLIKIPIKKVPMKILIK